MVNLLIFSKPSFLKNYENNNRTYFLRLLGELTEIRNIRWLAQYKEHHECLITSDYDDFSACPSTQKEFDK
jgi:hypothetical protein